MLQRIIRVEQVGATESHVSSVEIEYDKVLAVVDGEEVEAGLLLKLTDEGLIIDLTDKESGEVLLSGWQLIEDLVAKAH